MSDLRYNPGEMKARRYKSDVIREAECALKAREAAQHLIRKIEGAFRNVLRPRITWSVARGYDDEWILSEERIQELAAADSETTWPGSLIGKAIDYARG